MIIQQLLQYTVDQQASDLHLLVGAPPTVRIDGVLVPVPTETILTSQSAEQLVLGVLTPEQKPVFTTNKELDFSFALGETARFRVNTYYQKGSMAASFRHIPARIPTPEQLRLPDICHRFAQLRQGFILVTGPTGHGKSTTLAAVIDEICRTRKVHIITIEDPIEYVFSSSQSLISQREMTSDTHSWGKALRAVLREDPDVVMVGEMRDFETISAALTIAETGHLVFATLHTNSAAQTVDRIIDVFPENQQAQARSQMSANLEAVFSQRLVPKTAGGRIIAFEVMLGTPAVRTAIRDAKTHMLDNIISTSADLGMSTLENSLATLVRQSQITLEEAESFALRPSDLHRFVNK